MTPLSIVTRRARCDDVAPDVEAAARDRNDVIAREELAPAQFHAVSCGILATVAVTSEEECVGDLAAELAGDVDESFEANDGRTGDDAPFRMEHAAFVDLENLGFLIDDQTQGPFDGQDGQGFERRVQCEY